MRDNKIEIASLIDQGKIAAQESLNELLERKKSLKKVAPQFKVVVSDARDFLEEMKQKLDFEETHIEYDGAAGRERVEKEILDHAEKVMMPLLHPALLSMNDIVRDFTQAEHHVHRNYFQRHLHSFLLLSPFVRRAYSKPLGFPGDYEMMNMLYGNHDVGESLFARLINRYFCRVTAAQAVVDRVPYMLDKMNRAIAQNLHPEEGVFITSVGSGPAQEVQELIRTNPDSDRCRVSLVDMAQEALWHCHSRILDLKSTFDSRIDVRYLNRTVQQLIRDPEVLAPYTGQDLIYTVGLFDYLPIHIAKKLTQKLCQRLSDQGELVIGNFDVSNDSRYYMEYAAEWYLIHRTPEEMRVLAEGIPSISEVVVESNDNGVQLYLIIRKDRKLGSLPGRGLIALPALNEADC